MGRFEYTDEFVVESYSMYLESNKSSGVFAKELGRDPQRLREAWKRYGYTLKRKSGTKPNEDFFETIDIEIKAYLLGFFTSDGHIEKRKDYDSYTLKWDLSSYDEEILYLINEYIGNNYYTVFRLKDRYISGISITSKKLGEDLLKLGYDNRKTNTCFKLPDLSRNLMCHFIRGFFDGDGSVWGPQTNTGTNRGFSLTAKNIELLKIIQEHLPAGLKWYTSKVSQQILGTGAITDACTISCRSKQDLTRIYEYLYADATFFLRRKKSKFIQAIR